MTQAIIVVGNSVYKLAYKPDDYWYHVTTANYLSEIAKNGLLPPLEDGPGSSRGVHFSERTAVPRWYLWVTGDLFHREPELYELYYEKDAEDLHLLENKWIPVVLRVPKSFDFLDKEHDSMGTFETELWMTRWIEEYYPELFKKYVSNRIPGEDSKEFFTRAWKNEKGLEKLKESFKPYAKAIYTKNGVPSEFISVYNSYEWVPIAKWSSVPLEKALTPSGNGIRQPQKNPLVPTL